MVVIGILIALQINKLNEKSKLRDLEIKTLTEIKEGFKADTTDLNTNIYALSRTVSSGRIVLEYLNTSMPYNDSLTYHFSASLTLTRLISNDGPYEVLKSRGLDLISNDELRKKIVDNYDNNYESLRTWEKGFFVSDRYIVEQLIDLFDVIQFFEISTNGNLEPSRMTPHDPLGLKTNKRYKTLMSTYLTQSATFLEYTKFNLQSLEQLIIEVEEEIERLND